ncbi:hypothetical protein KKG48_00940 [Patescibacteria group bacterium]|nr:hypothetical protein [Patescibacteria group bacterium]MCG2694662.1 hypothetical protein [Candidatus Parcubacteria bacterium]
MKYLILILIVVIAFLNHIAIDNFLYWKFWWFDILMHFLGGFWVSLTALWFFYFSGFVKDFRKNLFNVFLISLVSIFAVGIGWEVFEFMIEISFSNNYVADTVGDLIMDVIGSLTVTLWLLVTNKKFFGLIKKQDYDLSGQ